MRLLKAALLASVLFALLVGSAAAATSAGLDPSFGNGGKASVAVAAPQGKTPKVQAMALSPDGRTYVLERSLLLAFEADGKPAAGFGKDGRLPVGEAAGDGDAYGLAVDAQGRVLLTGSDYHGDQKRGGRRVSVTPVYAAYVIRLLPDGSRDLTFGGDGEVQTTFGLPRPAAGRGPKFRRASVMPTRIVVDSMDRPIVGGGFTTTYEGCGYPVTDPFVGRLTDLGALDTTFAGRGYALPDGHGSVSALALTPEGGPATLSFGVSCGARSETEPATFSDFTASGEPAPGLDPARGSFYSGGPIAIDPQGRILAIQVPAPVVEGRGALIRLLPSGDPDSSFGKNGGVVREGPIAALGAFTVDAESRPILALFVAHRIELRRLTASGAADPTFGPGGRLFAEGGQAGKVAVDGEGRIYTAGVVKSAKLKTGFGIQVARFLPGS